MFFAKLRICYIFQIPKIILFLCWGIGSGAESLFLFCTVPVPVGDAFFEQPLNTVFMTQLSIVFERILDSIQKVFSNLFGWIIALFSA